MKKFLFLFIFINISVLSFSQTDSPTFLGISMNIKGDVFIQELLNNGYTFERDDDNNGNRYYTVKGKYLNFDNCTITVSYDIDTKNLDRVQVNLPNYSSYKTEIPNIIADFDKEFDCRIIKSDEVNRKDFIWFSKDKSYSRSMTLGLYDSYDYCMIRYYAQKSTEFNKRLVCKELGAKVL